MPHTARDRDRRYHVLPTHKSAYVKWTSGRGVIIAAPCQMNMAAVDGASDVGQVDLDAVMARVLTGLDAKDTSSTRNIFHQWGDNYEQDMSALGYQGYEDCGRRIAELVPDHSANILDLGCGPGAFGEKLNAMGYVNLYGVDIAESLMEISRSKGVYKRVENYVFGSNERAPFEDGLFHVVSSIAMFTPSCTDQTALPEISRLIAPGGYLIAHMRKSRVEMDTEEFHVNRAFRAWEKSGQWERLPDQYCDFYRVAAKDESIFEKTGVLVTLRKTKDV